MPYADHNSALLMPEFDGKIRLASQLRPGRTIWCSATACTSAKAGYIISHQNRRSRRTVVRVRLIVARF